MTEETFKAKEATILAEAKAKEAEAAEEAARKKEEEAKVKFGFRKFFIKISKKN